ncbi:MAG TPA: phosphohistidine phosphatase SixA [Planctomycetota bacterium]|nr:phosphohistidine phosphatase SixA [Planctomycetota bacterium]
MRVYLVQHAEAVPDDLDPEQPLTPGGRETARRVARWLAATGRARPGEILHSVKARAKQTAEIFARALATPPLREVAGLGPGDDVGPAAEAVKSAPGDLMLVGHLPHLNRLASFLVSGDASADVVRFRHAGVICLERQGTQWAILWAVVPELVNGTGP